ncbi:Conserved_hypothetical protein [Hexamita inflata]|uniref:Uncharacterized protein n=1 Tax=Hexamita inflata TaxID=28002 RepID=A0AA86PHM1_9EUKA|nr:Conserved hypothetical protein [Hexamita inflata]
MNIKLQTISLDPKVQRYEKVSDTVDETVLINTPGSNFYEKKMSKNKVWNFICGYLTPVQLLVYSLVGFTVIWCIYGAAYYTYNLSNHYSIMSCTFSFLGSWDDDSNPIGWYWFTIGMCSSFFIEMPIIMYVYQRVKHINKKIALCGNIFWVLGVCAQFLVGCFPSSSTIIFGTTKFRDIHNPTATVTFSALLVGAPCYAALVGYDRPTSCKKIGKGNILNHRYTDICIGIVIQIMIVALIILGLWQIVYPIMYAKDPTIGSNWSAAMNTIWSFPLWENVIIITLYLYLIIFPFSLPHRADGLAPKQRLSTTFKKVTLDQIYLKSEISKTWYPILSRSDVNVRNAADFLENLADCEEVEGLLSFRAIQTLSKLADMINSQQNADETKAVLKEFTKSSYELWTWHSTIKKCIK